MEKRKFKLNIIDIIIIIAVAAVVVFLGMKVAGKAFVPGQDYTAGNTHTYHITFYTEKVSNFVLDNTNIGDKAYDYNDKIDLGKVVSVERDDCVEYEIAANGEFASRISDTHSSAYITVEVKGKASDHGVDIDGTLYGIGHTTVIYAGMAKIYLPVYSIEQVD